MGDIESNGLIVSDDRAAAEWLSSRGLDPKRRLNADRSGAIIRWRAQRELTNQAHLRSALPSPPQGSGGYTYTSSSDSAVEELRIRGYTKVVTVHTQNDAILEYRLGQANTSFGPLNIASRLSPIGSALARARMGTVLEFEVPAGSHEWEVLGIEFMGGWRATPPDLERFECERLGIDRQLALRHVAQSIEDWVNSQDIDRGALVDQPGSVEQMQPGRTANSTYLSSDFYTRTTDAQEIIIQRPRSGPLIVEGIAGSGKTAVALGRLKALHDARLMPPADGRDDFFSDQKGMVVFVLSSHLVGYLRETLRELSLPDVPIREFGLLRHELAVHWAPFIRLALGSKSSRSVFRRTGGNPETFSGTLAWLRLIETHVGRHLRKRIVDRIRKLDPDALTQGFPKERIAVPGRAVEVSYTQLVRDFLSAIATLAEATVLNAASASFSVEGLLARLDDLRRKSSNNLRPETPYYNRGGKWGRLPIEDQVGIRVFNPDLFVNERKRADLLSMVKNVSANVNEALMLKPGELGEVWRLAVSDAASQPSTFSGSEIERVATRAADHQLADSDLDTLLTIGELMATGMPLHGKPKAFNRYSAVFIDEVQDFSPIQVVLMRILADEKRKAVTVVGDFMQRLDARGTSALSECFPQTSDEQLKPIRLGENKRQTANLTNYSATLRHVIDNSYPAPESFFMAPHTDLNIVGVSNESEVLDAVVASILECDPSSSLAVICPNEIVAASLEAAVRPRLAEHFRQTALVSAGADLTRLHLVHFATALPVKGLEFDAVVVPHFELFNLQDELQAHAAYVAVSRARSSLTVVEVALGAMAGARLGR